MKTRKSTAILITVWLATFVLYTFVKPETHAATNYPTFVNSVLSNPTSGTTEPPHR